MAALDAAPAQMPVSEPALMPGGESAYYLELFINACRDCLCRVSDEGDRAAAMRAWTRATQHWNKKARAA